MTSVPVDFSADAALLKDRVILVTGATGGFGRAASLALAEQGATVILLARNLRLVEGLYDDIEEAGYPIPAIYPINFEGATEADYQQLAENVENQLGRLDGMVHCAAMLGGPSPFVQSDTDTWYRVHQVNLHAPYLLTRACLPLLSRAAQGSVLFMVDDKQSAYWDAYQVSKQALQAMALLLAREYDGSSLRVNCFNPGKTMSPMQLRAYPGAGDNESLPRPEDHARTIVYLMSDRSSENGEIFTPPSA